jgi:hypothetical protein
MIGVPAVITKVELVVVQSRAALKSAPSLRPGIEMMDGCVVGNPEAIAIRNAWRFSFPVRTVSSAEYERIVARGTATFNG